MSEQMAIVTDVTLCIGCEDCVTDCKRTYGLAADRPWRWQNDVTDLSATRWTTIVNKPDVRYRGAPMRPQMDIHRGSSLD